MTAHLLPPAASAVEQELSGLSSRIDEINPAVIETIWDAWRCPSSMLPWLAWAVSVDFWEEGWDEVRKRQSIADSPEYHRRKGTRRAVEMLLALVQRPYELIEWWETSPAGRRGTARVHIDAKVEDVAAIRRVVSPLLATSKPKARPIVMTVGERRQGTLCVAGGILVETETTIWPERLTSDEASGTAAIAGGILIETETTVYPA
jgi:phage tail P2-like protein